jgi:signal recognition particle subunit SEC65
MEPYEIEKDAIIEWAVNYATYDELEDIAKPLYALYKERQLKLYPKQYAKTEKYKIHKNKLRKAERLSGREYGI